MRFRWFFGLLLLAGLARALPTAAPVTLADGGQPLRQVVTSPEADPTTRTAARELAEMLTRICGGTFAVAAGDGHTGLAVGVPADFPTLGPVENLSADDPLRRDDYLLRTHKDGVLLLGATPLAARLAVWDLLARLGYRRFFPSKTWEVVPASPILRLTADALERPDYAARRIWYGYGTWPENKPLYDEWCLRNRAAGSFTLNTGHAYDGIIAKNKATFAAHPEFFALVQGQRKPSKFCIANPELRTLVVEYAVKAFEAAPGLDSISLDPSDGGGWCGCEECAQLGSVSDRVTLLAAEAAEAVTRRFGQRYIGMYAYHEHSPPPTQATVHPHVIMSVATAFIKGGYTVDQLIDGWRARGANIFGIREYYSVNTWDRDLPGAARGANPAGLANSIPHFHAKGARMLSAESSDNWGPNGLGYYLAAQLLWDVDTADQLDALQDDFFTRAFGPAQEPMRAFYALIDGAKRPLLSSDLVGRMYRQLDAARQAAPDPAIRARIRDLLLYTRYVELFQAYEEARGAVRQAAFEAVIRHAYRIRATGMVHSYALYRDLAARDKSVQIPEGAAFNVPEKHNPWKSSAPFTEEEFAQILAQGIARNALLDFAPVSFSARLVPPAARQGKAAPPAGEGWTSRGTNALYTWVDTAPATIKLTVTGGRYYRDRGDVLVRLLPVDEPEGKAVAEATVAPDGQAHEVTLATPDTGLHIIEISDRLAGTTVAWPEGMALTLATGFGTRYDAGRVTFVFYVPKGTARVGGFSGMAQGDIVGPDGTVLYRLQGKREYFSVPVPPGCDGALWTLRGALLDKRAFHLLTVPPFLARSAAELLLPDEVVKADGTR